MKNSISILAVSIALAIVPPTGCAAVSKNKPKPGTVLWEYATKNAVPISAPPSLYVGSVCFGDTEGTFYVIDIQTGKLKSSFKLSPAGFPHRVDDIHSAAAIKDGIAFFSGQWVNSVAFDLNKGKIS